MLSGIILAAGESRRMDGHIKQLLKWGRMNFIETIILKMKSAGLSEIVVVLGANSEVIIQNTQFHNSTIVKNCNWQEGQLSSLKTGINALSSKSEGFILNPCDCPAVKLETYKKIINCWKENKDKIVIPVYANKKGHPVIFPSKFYKNFFNDDLPEGAKSLIKQNPDFIKLLEVDDKNITIDIDTFDDYEKMLKAVCQ